MLLSVSTVRDAVLPLAMLVSGIAITVVDNGGERTALYVPIVVVRRDVRNLTVRSP